MDLINDKLYDLKLITASDYTATGVITKAQWEYFKENLLFETEENVQKIISGEKDEENNGRADESMKEKKNSMTSSQRVPDQEDDPKPALKFELLLTEALESALQNCELTED